MSNPIEELVDLLARAISDQATRLAAGKSKTQKSNQS